MTIKTTFSPRRLQSNHSTINVAPLDPYLTGDPMLAGPHEQGWKDTVLVYSRTVTVIRVRFAPQDQSDYPFDATTGPGYVWHCHILEHEDHAMMRPYILTAATTAAIPQEIAIAIIATVAAIAAAVANLRTYAKRRSRTRS